MHGAGRPLTAKQLLTSNNVSPPVAAEALYAALDDLMARAGALTAGRRWGRQDCPLPTLCPENVCKSALSLAVRALTAECRWWCNGCPFLILCPLI